MAEKIDDDRFKSEVMRMLSNLINKAHEHDRRFDEHDRRFDEHDKRFDAHDRRFDEHDKRFDAHDRKIDEQSKKLDAIASDLKLVTRQFNDVGSMSIKDHQRIDVLEDKVANLEAGVH